MLASTYSYVVVGLGTVTFDLARPATGSAGGTIYYGFHPSTPSLAARLQMRVSHETTSKGVVRTLRKITVPILDGDNNVVDSFTDSRVITRSEKASTVLVKELIKGGNTLDASGTLAEDLANAEL